MKYLRTDIYDLKENGEIDYSSEIAEEWGGNYEAAITYLVRRGAEEKDLRDRGATGNDSKSFTVCVWERTDDGDEWLDNASERKYCEHFEEA